MLCPVLMMVMYLGPGFAVPVPQNRNPTGQRLQTNLGLKPTVPKVTNTAGSGNNKWTQFVAVSLPLPPPPPPPPSLPYFCNCPETQGWSPEELAEHENATSLKGRPFDCFCSSGDKHWLRPADPPTTSHDFCKCPSVDGWTSEQIREHQILTGLLGSVYHCFCSGPNGFSIHVLEPRPVNAEICQCPSNFPWTLNELDLLNAIYNQSGNVNDCFCEHGFQQHAIRKKEFHSEMLDEKIFNDSDYKEEHYEDSNQSQNDFTSTLENQNSSGTLSSLSQSHLTVLSLDGKLKEFKLGSLWVKLQD